MKPLEPEEQEIVRTMQRANISGPTAELRSRVLRAAREAWEDATDKDAVIGWTAAFAPVAASAAAAFLLVVGSGLAARHSLAPWEAVRGAAAGRTADRTWGALDERPFLNRIAEQAGAIRPEGAANAIGTYRSRLRKLLDDGTAAPEGLDLDTVPAETQSGREAPGELHAAWDEPRERGTS